MTGERRNPFNEIECGDHYARAMSGWSLLQASTRLMYDGLSGELRLDPTPGGYPFLTGSAWGIVASDGVTARVSVLHGELAVNRIAVARRASESEPRVVTVPGSHGDEAGPIRVTTGQSLDVPLAPDDAPVEFKKPDR